MYCARRERPVDGALTAALAVMAAVSGVGFASGQAVVLFFSQLERAAWPGMVMASVLFGMAVCLFMALARRTGAGSLTAALMRLPGRRWGRMATALYGLFCALVAIRMADVCGELGALTLPVRNGYLTGAAAAVIAAVAICASGKGLLPALGGAAVLFSVMLYSGLMLDARPVTTYTRLETVLDLSGNTGAMAALAALFASMNAVVSADAAAAFSRGSIRLWKAAFLSGMLMLLCLLCAHGAILRGGGAIFVQPLPLVILAARWGVAGFWLSAGFMYFLSVCTLSAATGAILSLAFAARECRAG